MKIPRENSQSGPRLSSRHHARGLTLLEILVVVAIVAVLVAASIPVVRSMGDSSKQAACTSNLRNIGAALQLYAQDNQGVYPETTHTALGSKAWISALEEQLGKNYERARVCPADPRREDRIRDGGTSYILNSYIFVPAMDPFGRPLGKTLNRPSLIPDPGRTMIAFVCSDKLGTGPGNDHTHSERWTSWEAVRGDISPDRFGGGSKDGITGRSNYLYVDGHVASINAGELKRLVSEGKNPAKPPET